MTLNWISRKNRPKLRRLCRL